MAAHPATRSFLDMKDYSAAARRYWWTVVPAGLAMLGWATFQVASMPLPTMLQVLACAAIAAVVGLFPVPIPNTKTSIAGGELFIFLLLLLFGPPAAVLAAALEGWARTAPRSAGPAASARPRWRRWR